MPNGEKLTPVEITQEENPLADYEISGHQVSFLDVPVNRAEKIARAFIEKAEIDVLNRIRNNERVTEILKGNEKDEEILVQSGGIRMHLHAESRELNRWSVWIRPNGRVDEKTFRSLILRHLPERNSS